MAEYLEVWGPAGVEVVTLEGTAVMVGRDPSNGVVLAHDPEVSRRHAVVERLPVGWCVRDLTSRNGTLVNGERVLASYALHHRDEIRVGESRIVFCGTAGGTTAEPTRRAEPAPQLTRREADVLRALFLPAKSGDLFTEPASTREIAEALYVSEAAVKQHLAHLYDKFGIYEGDRRRVRLANEALRRGAVSLSDVRNPRGSEA
jgi:predicted component of type VI protein secretion system